MEYPKLWVCPNCKTSNAERSRCYKCNYKPPMNYPDIWHCPNCSYLNNSRKICKECSYPNNLKYPALWHCPKCGKLLKELRTCPNCRKSSRKEGSRTNFKLKKNILIPLALVFFLVAIFYSINNNEAPVEIKSLVFNTSTTSIILPSWRTLSKSNTSITLRDNENNQLLYFIEPSYFSSTRNDLNRVYISIKKLLEGAGVTVDINIEYLYNGWEVVCFQTNISNSCLAGMACNNDVAYLQYDVFSNYLNSTIFESFLNSFCCNC